MFSLFKTLLGAAVPGGPAVSLLARFFTPAKIITIVFTIIITALVYSGYDRLMTKLGFETKDNVKQELVMVKRQLDETKQINATLEEKYNRLEKLYQQREEELKRLIEDQRKLQQKVADLVKKKEVQDKVVVKKIKDTTEVTERTVNLDKQLVEQNSLNQITALEEAYNELFMDQTDDTLSYADHTDSVFNVQTEDSASGGEGVHRRLDTGSVSQTVQTVTASGQDNLLVSYATGAGSVPDELYHFSFQRHEGL